MARFPSTAIALASAVGAVVMCRMPARQNEARVVTPSRASHQLVVTIVVDQLAAWVAAERFPALPDEGGFARLRREGKWVRAMRYEHAVTDTAPGHSALYTGAVPGASGIFANEVLGNAGEAESILHDPSTHMLSEEGPSNVPSSSLAALGAETLADRLHAEQPDAVIVSLSYKDRAALPGGGRSPTAALWFDTKGGRFVTSSAVTSSFPSWAGSFAADAVKRAEASTWTPLDSAWVRAHSFTPDDQPGEGNFPGYGAVFPHTAASAEQPAVVMRVSPFADDALLALGIHALEATHAREHTALLALSLSANDYIGHTFGPDSWEAWDELARLDRSLARFLTALDMMYGRDGYAVLLTADHGTTPMPEIGRHAYCDAATPDPWKRACGPVSRIIPGELTHKLISSARLALGPGDWIVGVSDPYVYLTPAAHDLEPTRRASLEAGLRSTLLAEPGVAAVYDVAKVPLACPSFEDETIDALVCRSIAPAARARGAASYLVLAPGSFFDPSIVVGKGTSHGSPYWYDRTVPLLVRAPGRVPAGAVIDDAVFTTFSRTAADLLGISPPHDAAPGVSLAGPANP